jgi:aspartyl protease family protein
MSDGQGPWKLPPPAPARGRRLGLLIWAALFVALGLGMVMLARALPDHSATGFDWAYLIGVLALVSANFAARRRPMGETVRNIAIWAGVVAVLLVGYTFRREMGQVLLRVRGELIPAYAVTTAPHELTLTEDSGGAYSVMGQVNGQPVRFMVDTGASDIVLSPADARRLGVDTAALDYSGVYETANGVGRGAAFTADSLQVGPIGLSNVPMSINQAPMSASLLGMRFLKQLDSFEINDGKLILRWRG